MKHMSSSRSRRQVRLSRALGIPLTPKAVRYFERRPYGPSEHGRARRRTESDYAVRLKEKQRLRAQYGIREAQLQRVFQEARREKGLTGESCVGRSKEANEEFSKDVRLPDSHLGRVNLKENGVGLKIVRRSLPFGKISGEHGLMLRRLGAGSRGVPARRLCAPDAARASRL